MLFGQDRDQLRSFYIHAWRKKREGAPLEPLENLVVQVIEEHPEYQGILENTERALGREYLPEDGDTNPFMHMGMHIAIQEQLQAGRPAGIAETYRELMKRLGDAHAVEHRMMECLAEALWKAQRAGRPPDEAAYLDCVRSSLP
jgi:hypothetical protein